MQSVVHYSLIWQLQNYIWWIDLKGEEQVYILGWRPCSLNAKYSKDIHRCGICSQRWDLLPWTSQLVLWFQSGVLVTSGRRLSLGIPWTWLWVFPTTSVVLAGSPRPAEGHCMGPCILCLLWGSDLCIDLCGYFSTSTYQN